MYSPAQLEYNKIKKILKTFCHSAKGKLKADLLEPMTGRLEIEDRLQFVTELQKLLQNNYSYNFREITDIIPLFEDLIQQTFDFEEFRDIYRCVKTANSLSVDFDKLHLYPRYQQIVDKIVSFPYLEERFQEIFAPEGDVKDTASRELNVIRSRRKKVRQNIIARISSKIDELDSHNYLYDKLFTQRDGRYVVPIKEGSASFVQGIVHGRSASRSSVYVEPAEVVNLNNEIGLLEADEKEEIFRIFREYTAAILEGKDSILFNNELLGKIDFHFAIAAMSEHFQAVAPEIIEKSYIKLVQARHPLLIETLGSIDKVVPFNLELGNDYKILLISGPNTGGKTVTLKTIGLLTLMALSGVPIPAHEDSKIGIFSDIIADIGDNQSLENSLSTFSSHIQNIRKMLDTGSESSLILIDEIGAATDPEQGAGLGQAILEKLAKKKVTGIITTHYTALKIYAEQHPLCRNASMEFDPRRHVPTFSFREGLPGHSFAIEVAAELGLDEELIDRARNLAGNQSVELTEILKKLTSEKNQLAHQNYQYKLKTSLLDQKIREHQQKLENIARETKDIKKKSIREAQDYLITLQNELQAEIKNIKKVPTPIRKKAISKVIKKTSDLQTDIREKEEELSDLELIPVTEPEIGMKVWVKELDSEGEIIEIKKGNIKVDLNGFLFTTDISRLYKIEMEKVKPEYKKKAYNIPKKQVRLELKLLGYRFEEALPELDTFIDDAWLNGLDFIRIVHGKGTGALRNKVRNYLKQNGKIKEFYTPPPEAGGDGVTVAVLKEQ